MPRPGTSALTLVGLVALASEASAQVAFQPGVGTFQNGVTLSATPAVSADRRYVRLTLVPGFNALEGFDTVPVPAAVSGGGFRSVGVPVENFAGMGGLIGADPSGYGPRASGVEPTGAFASPMASALLGGDAGPFDRPRFAPARGDLLPRQARRRPSRGGTLRKAHTGARR